MIMIRSQLATTTTTTTSLCLLLLALAVSGTSAKSCYFYEGNSIGGIAVSNQEELETVYAGCTEIYGNVNIATNYTGDFYFPNVTNIFGGLRTQYINKNYDDELALPTPLLTSIVVPDLNSISYIDINNAAVLTTISFPNLTLLNHTLELAGMEDYSVDFPSLKSNGDLFVTGNSTRLNFPSLESSKQFFVTGNSARLNFPKLVNVSRILRVVSPAPQMPLDIDFPALQFTSDMYLQGNITNLSMPELFTVGLGDKTSQFNRNINILTYGNPLNISFPRLYEVEGIVLDGTIGSISFPVLKNLKNLKINTSTPLNVTLEPIQGIPDMMLLSGDITAVSMTSITKLGFFEVDSNSASFYCNSIASEIERITGNPLDDYSCTDYHHKNNLPLILGLSIGLGVPFILAVVCYICWRRWKSKKTNELKANEPPGYKMGVPPAYSANGPPTHGDSEGGERVREGDVADPSGHPNHPHFTP
ncbi:hypothetical protein V496_09610 [Pseudogymnoascus sp. VKM F-4515 (FW-2607)]|nr:hypothetical protein V496_09610 [Pseudogymnoascus sp. VKM F-4515 (FW-2607)]